MGTITAATIAQWATAIGSALSAIILTVLLPAIVRFLLDHRNQAAFAAVSRACMHAVTGATIEMVRTLEAAKDPASPGGKEVTLEERKTILRAGITRGVQVLHEESGATWAAILKAYGGEDAVKDALEAAVRKKVLGDLPTSGPADAPPHA